MASIFTRIVQGEIPCYKIAETSDFLAFLDINPLAEGHTLVIPKQEIDYIFDLDDAQYAAIWHFARKVGHAIETVMPCQRIGIAVIGLEVPHAHIHLVPINSVGDLNFMQPKLTLSAERLQEICGSIQKAFQTSTAS